MGSCASSGNAEAAPSPPQRRERPRVRRLDTEQLSRPSQRDTAGPRGSHKSEEQDSLSQSEDATMVPAKYSTVREQTPGHHSALVSFTEENDENGKFGGEAENGDHAHYGHSHQGQSPASILLKNSNRSNDGAASTTGAAEWRERRRARNGAEDPSGSWRGSWRSSSHGSSSRSTPTPRFLNLDGESGTEATCAPERNDAEDYSRIRSIVDRMHNGANSNDVNVESMPAASAPAKAF